MLQQAEGIGCYFWLDIKWSLRCGRRRAISGGSTNFYARLLVLGISIPLHLRCMALERLA